MSVKIGTVAKILCLTPLLALVSCGDTNPGPSVMVFKTVTVTPSILTPLTPVNVFTGAACTNGVLTGATPAQNTPLQVQLTSNLYNPANTGQTGTTATGQYVIITGYSVTYTPTNGGPPVNDPNPNGKGLTLQILPGASQTAQIYLTSPTTEGMLQSNPVLQSCTSHSYSYNADITLFGTEEGGTNAQATVRTVVTYQNTP